MIQEALCNAFCGGVSVTEIPIGFAVRAPFQKSDGDYSSFYFRKHESENLYRIEDNGFTIADLEMNGFDFDKESRFEAFTDMLADHHARYDEQDVLLTTDYMPIERLSEAAVSFSYLMARMDDLLLMVGHRVRKSFKEDLAEVIEQQFAATCKITENAYIDDTIKDYLVDFVIRAPDNRLLAVFAGSGELKALESLLFWEQIQKGDYSNLQSMIVLEEPKPTAIKDRTLSRVMNSGLHLATLDGNTINLGEKLKRTLHPANAA